MQAPVYNGAMMNLRKTLTAIGLLWAAHFSVLAQTAVASTSYQALPADVLRRLAAVGIKDDQVFLLARPVQFNAAGAQRQAFAHQADQPAQMASLVKLLTTGAALSRLGPEHAFRTELLGRRDAAGDRVLGPLYVRGSGDPDFQIEDLWLLLRQLRQSGVTVIEGPLRIDDTQFALRGRAPGPAGEAVEPPEFTDDAVYRAYHARASAVLLSHGATPVSIRVRAGQVRAQFDTAPSAFRVDSQLRPKPGPCVAWKDTFQVQWQGSQMQLSGDFPVACGDQRLPVRVPDSRAWLAAWVAEIWTQLGGVWGQTGWEAARVPDGTPVLQSWRGRELSLVVRNINKFSNNVMAQNLMLSITPPGQTTEQVLSAWLGGLGVTPTGLRVDSGSGLSRTDRLSPRLLGDALAALYLQPAFAELLVSLPRAGRDGTLSSRFAELKMAAHLKTGRLRGVSGLAGYLRDSSGQYWVWVSVLNGDRLEDRSDAHDILLRWFERMLP